VPGFWFCFMQLFMDTAPNIMLRWELDQYVVYFASGHVQLKGDISSDVGKWINWRVRFDISSDASKGFFEVYKDQALVGSFHLGVVSDSDSGVPY